jgi:hypothetical protein
VKCVTHSFATPRARSFARGSLLLALLLRSTLGEMTVDLESSDLECSDRDRQELLDSPENWSRVRSLPALPERHIWTMRRESVLGCTLVCFLVSLLVSLTQGVALAPGAAAPRPLIWAALALIYTEAAVALLCLLGLLVGNPGEVKRSPQSCFPMPESVADRLSQGESLNGLANVSFDGRTYCAPIQTDREGWERVGAGVRCGCSCTIAAIARM